MGAGLEWWQRWERQMHSPHAVLMEGPKLAGAQHVHLAVQTETNKQATHKHVRPEAMHAGRPAPSEEARSVAKFGDGRGDQRSSRELTWA